MVEGVRPAGPEDAEEVRRLTEAGRRELSGHRGGPELLAGLPAPPDKPHVLLGSLDGAPLGIAVGWIDMTGGPPVGRIGGCYVEPGARGVGLGTALVEGLLRWFADSNCEAVDATALPGDRATKQLFEQSGFRARLLVLRRPLH